MTVVWSCQSPKSSIETQTVSNRLPSATEVFDLRSKCAALAAKIMEENIIGPALAQEQLSHYNPESNRCYVRLEVHTGDLSTPRDKYRSSVYFYDGQTREMLMTTTVQGDQKSAMIFSDSLLKFAPSKGDTPTYEEAAAIISKFMAEDRKP
jgi:hypothetical protein